MAWEGVTVSEQRQRFLEDYQLGLYRITELADRFGICAKTAHKWIKRYKQYGQAGYHELSRRPHSCPWQTELAIAEELVRLRKAHPSWGPAKLLDVMARRDCGQGLPAVSTAAEILRRAGLVKPRRRFRRAHPGCPKTQPQGPNDIWAADYKGQFRLKNGQYCFPLTVSDLASRYLLGCDAHPAISLDLTQKHFRWLFEHYGLPNRIRTGNGVPFASNALARLSQLAAWFIKLGIYPELIEPGRPSQNGIHERMHRTLKQEATIPPAGSLAAQQRKLDRFREGFNGERPHQALGMKACLAGHRVQFATATQWVMRLATANHEKHLEAYLRQLERTPLIIIDEVGYIPFDAEAANLFFQLVSSRYERGSVIVTSNKPFTAWGEIFGDPVVASAMIDRLVHHAVILSLKGDSYRLRDKKLTATKARVAAPVAAE